MTLITSSHDVRETITALKNTLANNSFYFTIQQLPEDFAVVYGEAEGELSVGGVFLRIFIAQPAWVLRKPREFLIALLEKFTELLEKNNPHVR